MTSLTNAAAAEAPPETLIPSLPYDLAVQCLARLPKRYHPVLAAVSKPVRSLISSDEFSHARSAHNWAEILPYLMIQDGDSQADGWFTIRPRPTGDFIIARIPGAVPDDHLDCSKCAAVGPKIYVLGSTYLWCFDCRSHSHMWERGEPIPTALLNLRLDSTECVAVGPKIYVLGCGSDMWIFNCQSLAWDRCPYIPPAQISITKIAVLGCKIFVFKWPTDMICFSEVFDTVAGKWEARKDLKWNDKTSTWEVFESGIRLRVVWCFPTFELNGLSCCYYSIGGVFNCFDEITETWKEIKRVNRNIRVRLNDVRMSNVGGNLAVTGWTDANNGGTMATHYLEIEVKKDEAGDFRGKVLLWLQKDHSTFTAFKYTSIPVSV